jgi:hypothetical protein
MSSRIWIVYAEVRDACGSALPPKHGAFVECYVPAASADEAAVLARNSLEGDGYTVTGPLECIAFDGDAWDDDNDPEREVRTTAGAAKSQDCIHYGTFRAFPE